MENLERAYALDIKIRIEDEKLPPEGIAVIVDEFDKEREIPRPERQAMIERGGEAEREAPGASFWICRRSSVYYAAAAGYRSGI